ncbi:MAG: tRNA lysidine(34) synthetase TilS [Myxococcota bacterium]
MLDADFEKELEGFEIRTGRILVAVSGGRDSMVLLDLLKRWLPGPVAGGVEAVVGHINHGLRGLDSEADEAFTRQVADKAGLAFCSRRVDPEAQRRGPSRTRPTLEEAARNLRRRALTEMAAETNCDWIMTAHHGGDQAETVLLRLLRGTGPDGLAAMSPRSEKGVWLRPLLRVLPDAIKVWAVVNELEWREDASNQERKFARNRLRLDWIPKLSDAFNPQLLRALGDLAEASRQDREWLETIVDDVSAAWIETSPEAGLRLALLGWEALPEALARRLVRRALGQVGLGRDVTRVHLQRVLLFLRQGRKAPRNKKLELPGGFVVQRRDDFFELFDEKR